MKEARLVSISCEVSNPWAFFEGGEGMTLPGDGAAIKTEGLKPGIYGMTWGFVLSETSNDIEVCFRLYNGSDPEEKDALLLPAIPYFSCALVINRSSGLMGSPGGLRKALSEMFPEHAKDRDVLALGNKFAEVQSKAFEERMNQWIDFSAEKSRLVLGNLNLMISSSFMMLSLSEPKIFVDVPLAVLPEGVDLDRFR